jgi:hypothetical protein|nr:MAG TPA: hypothetical protein [Caudoviricetes sp.]
MDGIISGKIDTSLLSWKTEQVMILPHEASAIYSLGTKYWEEIRHFYLKIEGKGGNLGYNFSAYLPFYMINYSGHTECYIRPSFNHSTVNMGVRVNRDDSSDNNYYLLEFYLYSASYLDDYVESLEIGTLS